MPLTWITAWEALVERMEIQEGDQAGILPHIPSTHRVDLVWQVKHLKLDNPTRYAFITHTPALVPSRNMACSPRAARR